MHLAQDGAKYGEATEEGGWDDGIAAHTNIEGAFTFEVKSQLPFLYMSTGRRMPQYWRKLTIARFVEAMVWIAERCKDGYRVSAVLQSYGCINDKSLRPANAQVRVEKDNMLLPLHSLTVLLE